MLDEVIAERGRDRDSPPACPALGADGALLGIPRALDMDDAGRKVDVLPAEREQLAAAEAGVHRRRPQRTVALRERREQPGSLSGRGDAVTGALHGRKFEPRGRVHGNLSAGHGAPEDRAQGHHSRATVRTGFQPS